METHEAILPKTARLTEREKEVLRAWLEHKTAKEIALDLDISHHAVEKRLKMARTKLDVASSLEAARLLAKVESTPDGYQQTVTGSADLQSVAQNRQQRPTKEVALGVCIMAVTAILAVALAHVLTASDIETEIEIEADPQKVFALLDEDASGFLENPESPFVTGVFLDPDYPGEEGTVVLGDASDPDQIASFYADADTDGDLRVSIGEYQVWNAARLAELGLEVRNIVRVRRMPES